MANEIGGAVIWNLDVDKSKLSQGLTDAKNEVNNFADNAEKKFSNMAQSISSSMKKAQAASQMFAGGIVAIGTAMIGAAGLGVKTAAEFETLQIALETVTGSSEQATKAMATIKKTAKDSPFFEVSTLAQFVQVMAASGQAIDDAVASGIKFGDVAAAFGKGNYEMTRMGNTLSQVIGKGKADVVDFKELVNAGWVSVRKDTAAAMGVTMAQFEEMVSAGEVGYDQISKAAAKFAGSAEKQSSSFRALWSRLRETVSTTFADITLNTGIFDSVKLAITGMITAIESIKPEQIQSFLTLLTDNLPIITGMIVGALTPAIVAAIPAVIALGASFLALIPYIAAGAAIGYAIKLVIDALGGWEAAQLKIGAVLQSFVSLMKSVWSYIKEFVSGMIEKFGSLVNFFKAMPGNISSALSGVKNAITQPFTDAWNSVKGIAENIKNSLDKINPYHRNSPSLVDNVKAGVSDIIGEYKSLKNISLPSLSGLAPALEYQPAFTSVSDQNTSEPGSSGGNQYITFEQVNVQDRGDIDSMVRELGFMASVTPGMAL